MKTTYLPVLLIVFFGQSTFAQINFEHSFTTSAFNTSQNTGFFLNSFNTGQATYYYTYNDSSGSAPDTITLYDGNYGFYKTFSLPSAYVEKMYFITEHLFNDDDLIEFLYLTYHTLYLVNENGDVLYTWSDRWDAKLIETVDDGYKLIVFNRAGATPYPVVTDIYALDGTLSAGQSDLYLDRNFIGFPIPVQNSLTISTGRPLSRDTVVEIFNGLGQKIITKSFRAGDENLTIDTDSLQSGAYVYRINGGEAHKFVKR